MVQSTETLKWTLPCIFVIKIKDNNQFAAHTCIIHQWKA